MATPFVIRRAAPDQVDEVRDLSIRAYSKWLSVTPRKPRPMTADYESSIHAHRFDVLYDGNALIGLIETLWSAYFSTEYKDVAAFSILIVVLIFLPTGLLGRPEVEKV